MKFKPTVDRVLIQRDPAEKISPGGIYLPTTGQDESTQGTIMAVGPKVECVKLGDRVAFSKYAGSEVEIDGEKCVILEEESVLGVLD